MSMFELVPLGWFSWDFSVLQNGSPIAEIDISSWREKGVLAVGGSSYNVYREGLMSGAFVLESNGAQLARAEKPSALRRSFTIQREGKTWSPRESRNDAARDPVISTEHEGAKRLRGSGEIPTTLAAPCRFREFYPGSVPESAFPVLVLRQVLPPRIQPLNQGNLFLSTAPLQLLLACEWQTAHLESFRNTPGGGTGISW